MPPFGDIALTLLPYLIGFLFALISYIFFVLRKQWKLIQFFGADKSARRVNIYLSSLLVPRGCASGFDGLPRSYQGIAIPTEELHLSTPLAKTLMVDPFENIPPVFSKYIQEKIPIFEPLKVKINASPMSEREIDFSTRSLIAVGSQGYNVVTHYFVNRNLTQLKISNNGTAIEIMKGKDKGEVIRPASNQHDIAVLERLVDPTNNNTKILICAGLGVIGTMGAIQYLIDHWQELDKTYHLDDFAIVLQFGPTDKRSLEDILKGTVIRRIPEA